MHFHMLDTFVLCGNIRSIVPPEVRLEVAAFRQYKKGESLGCFLVVPDSPCESHTSVYQEHNLPLPWHPDNYKTYELIIETKAQPTVDVDVLYV